MFLTLDDFEAAAHRRLPACLYGFASNGSERGASVEANARSFGRWSFVPRMLVDVSEVSHRRTLLGTEYAAPFGIAPMGGCALFAHRCDLALARAAQAQRIPFVLSAASSIPLETILEQAPDTWYQGYMPASEERIMPLLARLKSARVKVLVLTVDVPIASNRDKDKRLGFAVPVRPSLGLALDGVLHPRWMIQTLGRSILSDGIPRLSNFTSEKAGPPIIAPPGAQIRNARDRFTWEHVKLIRRSWDGALVIKGILYASDAAKAREAGVDALIVSNHGGRQLDGAMTPMDALPGVLEAAAGIPVCIDGGVRRGTDVLKALALGARMVFVGRPMLYSASVQGQAGVEAAIQILQREIAVSLALLGAPNMADLDRSFLHHAG
jgi:L-lactate dehydrogenase (cytochrome)